MGKITSKITYPIRKVVEINGKEVETLKCPYCKGEVQEGAYPFGYDAYTKMASCKGCGAEWSE